MIKRVFVGALAGGLAFGVLLPGSVANAEVGAVHAINADPSTENEGSSVDPSVETEPVVPGEGADPQPPLDPAPVDPGSIGVGENSEDPEAPALQNGSGAEPEVSPDEGLAAKVAEAAPKVMAFGSAAYSMADGFRAGYIISDAKFYRRDGMTVSQIQAFLNQEIGGGRCTIGDPGRIAGGPAIVGGKNVGIVASKCLKDMRFASNSRAADKYCSAYSGKSSESAAEVIAKVSKACGISAQALLVMLDKEQSLVSDSWPTTKQFDRAMGYTCRDSGTGGSANCDSKYFGFFNQVYSAARQFQIYRAFPNSYNHRPFTTNAILFKPVLENPTCGTAPVYIQNYATAGLYNYTPYQPNRAALAGGKDACSSYGNRNFYAYYKQWFGSPTTFFSDVSESHQFYKEIEWMGTSGLSTGFRTDDGRGAIYQPSTSISREAMAAFLYRLKKANFTPPATSPFADVKPGDPFYREITWMHAMGYSTGTKQPGGKPLYAPKDPVSRSAMAAFLYRFKGASYAAPASSPFADMKPGDKFYREITWMYAVKYSTGNKQPSGKPTYLPRDNVSRGAMAAFIYRMQH